MNNKYVTDGYTLMNKYMTEQRIKTRERNFRRRLYFFNNVLIAENNQEKALVNFLNVVANVDYTKKGEE